MPRREQLRSSSSGLIERRIADLVHRYSGIQVGDISNFFDAQFDHGSKYGVLAVYSTCLLQCDLHDEKVHELHELQRGSMVRTCRRKRANLGL